MITRIPPGARILRIMQPLGFAVLLPFVSLAAVAASEPDDDFAARCAAPGVVLCNGLDNEADLETGELGLAADRTRQSEVDTSQKASGTGSLKFTLRAGVRDKNIGGYWSTELGREFGSGDTIYVQYRWRATPEYFSNNNRYWGSSIKQINIHGPRSTCQGAEFTTILQRGFPIMYTNCGDGWFTDVETNQRLSRCSADCLLEQGDSTSSDASGYNCHYQNQVAGDGTGSGCFYPPAETWITHYEIIRLGSFGGSNSEVDAFEAHDGSGYKQWQRVDNVPFNSGGDDHFSYLRFETYMTEIDDAAPVPAYIWYDELIVSTQPIAAPGNAGSTDAKPEAPTDVQVSQALEPIKATLASR